MRSILCLAFYVVVAGILFSQNVVAQVNKPGNGNPLIPGYFADPTIKKFGDTWYCYATTDGIKLASGAPQVWISKDFRNWYDYKFELPRETENVWAPDVVIGPDGKYYYYYCSCQNGCSIYGYVSDTPIGPWTSLMPNNGPIIAPGFLDPIIPLDPHVFKDDDGSYYIYFCTWATYDGHGVGWAKMNADMKSFSDKGIIPNTQLPGVFEAPFMLKRNGVYYLTYSAGSTHDGTYQVRYATSNGPHGTFTYGENNPITQSTTDGTIDAPGHHSVFQDGEKYYIAYHRHDNPHSTGGLVRQVCIDELQFDGESIKKVELSHEGIGFLGENQIPFDNIALTKKVKATSEYTDVVNKYSYLAENAVDDNNGTLWKASSDKYGEALAIDLGSVQSVKRVLIDFEYPIFYYQYRIEHSTDSVAWSLYADKSANKRPGSPMVDDKDVNARFIRITITGMQKPGLLAGIWNVKIYNDISDFEPLASEEETEAPLVIERGNKLVDLTAEGVTRGEVKTMENKGTLGGTFTARGTLKVDTIGRRKAIIFAGSQSLRLSESAPKSLSWNSSFSVVTWVYNPKIGNSECIVTWAPRGGPLGTYAAVNYGTNTSWGAAAHWEYPDMGFKKVPVAAKWHHIVVTFDGGVEKIYVDGQLDAQEQKSLYVHEGGPIIVGWSTDNTEYLSGGISSLQMYDYALSPEEIKEKYETYDPNIIASLMDEQSAHLISLYPNPTQDSNQVVIEFDNPHREPTSIRVLNMQGTKLFEGDTRSNSYVLNVKDYVTGPYLVVVRNSQLRATKKFIVK